MNLAFTKKKKSCFTIAILNFKNVWLKKQFLAYIQKIKL